MMAPLSGAGVAQAIQLAIAPALLLVGTGSMLNVVTGRLSRIVDRARHVEAALTSATGAERALQLTELPILDRRMRVCQRSVGFITSAALMVCLLVITLFAEGLNLVHVGRPIAFMFAAAMVFLFIGLVFFLIETSIALRVVRVSETHIREAAADRH